MGKLAILGGEPVRRKPLPTVNDKSGRNIGEEELNSSNLLSNLEDYSGTPETWSVVLKKNSPIS